MRSGEALCKTAATVRAIDSKTARLPPKRRARTEASSMHRRANAAREHGTDESICDCVHFLDRSKSTPVKGLTPGEPGHKHRHESGTAFRRRPSPAWGRRFPGVLAKRLAPCHPPCPGRSADVRTLWRQPPGCMRMAPASSAQRPQNVHRGLWACGREVPGWCERPDDRTGAAVTAVRGIKWCLHCVSDEQSIALRANAPSGQSAARGAHRRMIGEGNADTGRREP